MKVKHFDHDASVHEKLFILDIVDIVTILHIMFVHERDESSTTFHLL